MSTDDPTDISDLFDDYLVECDEHLTGITHLLLAIEANPGAAGREQFDSLFRHFHTLKGLSGIAGVPEAEELAHHLEEYLGALRKGDAVLSGTGIGVLVDGVKGLEAVIVARRDGGQAAPVAPLIQRIADLLSARPKPDPSVPVASPPTEKEKRTGPPPEKLASIRAALRDGGRAWKVTFTPTPALAERGTNVSVVRERIKEFGEIVYAEPSPVPGGGISFTFFVLSRGGDSFAGVAAEGVTVSPYEPPLVEPVAEPASLAPRNVVRVDLARLDELMQTASELVITRARLDTALDRAAAVLPEAMRRELRETSQTVERQLRDLRDGVMRVRLVPVRDVFARMRLVVRDVARETGQDVDLELTGEHTEIDKFVVERLADPLLHLVRNAVSHGLEPPAERVAAGKNARGRIDLRAAAAGGVVVVEVEDDGRGIEPDVVFAKARARGLVPPGGWSDPGAVMDLICTPGFSTRETADRASGRGVGMDVVRRAVEELGGSLELTTRPKKGTRFTARLPLSLAIADALIVIVGSQTYAAPQAAVREVVLVEPGAITAFQNNELLRHHGGVLPLLRLGDVFGSPRASAPFPALVVGEGAHAVALAVDRVVGLREIVVRQSSDPLVQAPGLAGATELGDGRAILILDAAGLARYARSRCRTV